MWLFEPQLIKFEKKTINRVLINRNRCFETPIQSPSWTFNPRLTRFGNLGQHCTLQQAFKQVGAVHMHNHDDTYPPLPWFEPGTSRLPVVTSPSRSGQPQSLRMSHRGRPYDVPRTEDVGLPIQFQFNVGPASQPIAGSIPVYRLRRWPNTNPTLGLLYALSQHISKHMYQASSKCGVSKHLKHVRNSILSFLKHMLVFWNTYRSTSKCGISVHLTHVCNSILAFF